MRNEQVKSSEKRKRGGLDGGDLVRLETRLSKDAFELLRLAAVANHRSLVAEARFALEQYVKAAA